MKGRASFQRRFSAATAGFTLLEAIVAVAIVGLALIPLVSFLSLSANELLKAGEANERSFATLSIVALLDTLNPANEASGSIPLNDKVTVTWESEELIPLGRSFVPNSGLPSRQLGFYKVHVSVFRSRDQWFAFDLRKVGYTEIQSLDSLFTNAPADTK